LEPFFVGGDILAKWGDGQFLCDACNGFQELDPFHLEDTVLVQLINLRHHGEVEGQVDIAIDEILFVEASSTANILQLIKAHE
jgi:hypothetical protein